MTTWQAIHRLAPILINAGMGAAALQSGGAVNHFLGGVCVAIATMLAAFLVKDQ